MLLFKYLWRRRSNLIIFLLSSILVFSSFNPLLTNGIKSVFYSIDPDVVYVSNALSYVTSNLLGYHDHPGIPSIYLISVALLPVRIYAKILPNIDFINYVYNNYEYIFYYLRIFQTILFFTGLNIYLTVIYKLTKSLIATIFAILALSAFSPIYNLGLSISAETFNFFLISLWIWFFTLFFDSRFKKLSYLSILLFLAGILFANRATNFFYLVGSIFLIFNTKQLYFKYFIYLTVGFLIGVLPSSVHVVEILKRLLFFAGSSGLHGEGMNQLIDFNAYLNSLLIYWSRDKFFIYTLITTIIYLFIGFKKISKTMFWLTTFSILVTLLFMKFPLSHYLVANYQFIVFILAYLISKNKKLVFVLLVPLYLMFSYTQLKNYLYITNREMLAVSVLENYVTMNKSRSGELWEWARSKNFALLWTNSYGNQVFAHNLQNNNIGQYKIGVDVFKTCWDHLYIQKDSFKNSNLVSIKFLKITDIKNSQNILLVESDHCSKK